MKIIGVIPARYKSSRFPGKPLVDILGKPMIAHIYQNASEVSCFNRVLVATDDERIGTVCQKHDMEWMLTGDNHKTGTDRVAEVARQISADLYVNIQGDEPMLGPEIIAAAIEPYLKGSFDPVLVTNLMTPITRLTEIVDIGVPKVVVNAAGDAVYLSRLPIPYPKETRDITYFKQVCVYGYTPSALKSFATLEQGPSERAEGIELLRFIENGIKVCMIQVVSDTIAVDTPDDAERVRRMLSL